MEEYAWKSSTLSLKKFFKEESTLVVKENGKSVGALNSKKGCLKLILNVKS